MSGSGARASRAAWAGARGRGKRHFGELFSGLIDRDACWRPRVGVATAQAGFRTLVAATARHAECSAEPPSRAPFLQPVVCDDADDEHDTGDEQPEKKRIHRDAVATCRGSVSASSSASAMSTATTRDTPGSGMVMPTS